MHQGSVPSRTPPSSGRPLSPSSFTFRGRSRVILLALSLAVSASALTYAASSPQELVALRTEVDDLAGELEVLRTSTRTELGRLRAERDSLKRRVKRAKAERSAARNQSNERKRELAKLEEQGNRWVEPLRATISRIREHVGSSLPFQRPARLAELSRIEQQLDGASPDLVNIADELWRLVEQEESLGRQVGVGRQAAEIEGQRQLVEVVRLGNALIYFRTATGAVGLVEQSITEGQSRERWLIITAEEARLMIEQLFERALRGEHLGPNRLVIPKSAVQEK